MRYSKFFLCFIFICVASLSAHATKRYWVGGASLNWNVAGNWSTISGGGGTTGVPGSTDTAYFDGGSTVQCIINASVNVKRFEIKAGYNADTVKQNGNSITIGTGGFSQAAGTFFGNSGTISNSGIFSLTGGVFTSTGGTMVVVGNFTFSGGTFNNNLGLVKFTTTNTITGSITFSRLEFNAVSSSRTFTIASGTTLTVDSTLSLSGSTALALNTGNIHAKKDITVTNTIAAGGGTATVTINGTASQTITANTTLYYYFFPNIVINKSSDTLHLVGIILSIANWTYTAGVIDAGTSMVYFGGASATITGSHALYNVTFGSGSSITRTIASGTTLTVNHNLYVTGAGNIVFNGGNISAKGNIAISNTSASTGGGTTTITINGTGTQTFTGGSAGQSPLPNIVINKSSSDTLKLVNTINVAGNWTYTAGIISEGTSTVEFINGLTITGSHTLYNAEFNASTTNTFVIASGTTLTLKNKLTYSGAGAITLNTGTIDVKGDIYLNNTSTGGGTALIDIVGTSDQTMHGPSSFQNWLSSVKINKSSGTLYLTNNIRVAGNWTYTAGGFDAGHSCVVMIDTKTISGSLTFNGLGFQGTAATSTITISSGTTLTVDSTLRYYHNSPTNSNLVINTGSINAHGDILTTNLATSGGGSATITVNGTGSQTLTGSGVAGEGKFCNITINKSSGTLTLADIITFDKNFIYTAGTVAGGTSTANFTGSGTVDPENSGYSVPFYNVQFAASRTLSGKLTATNNLTINSTFTLTSGGYDILVGGNWTDNGTFSTSGSGYVTFNGSGAQKISKTVGSSETFKKLAINKSAGEDTLKSPVIVTDTLKLTKGIFISTSSNYMRLNDNSGLIGGSDSAFVSGVMRKLGNDAFTFPLGAKTFSGGMTLRKYHPLGITAPSTTSDEFSGEYIPSNQSSGSTIDSSLESISNCEYWNLNRTAGSTNVKATLGFNTNTCNKDNPADMVVAGWDGSKWVNYGHGPFDLFGSGVGRVTSNIALPGPTFPLVIGIQKNKYNSYATLKRQMDGIYYVMYDGKLFFKYDEEYHDIDGKLTFNIYNQNTNDNALFYSSNNTLVSALGDNRYYLNTMCLGSGMGGGYYLLEVINEKGEKFYLRFKNVTSMACVCTSCVSN